MVLASITQELVWSGVILQFAEDPTSRSSKMSKGTRSWCYTLNNYSEEEASALRSMKCVYHVMGFEIGKEGTPHIQGFIHLKDAKTLTAMKKAIPRAHLEERRGTFAEASDYSKKEGNYEEYGELPMDQKQKGECNKKRWRRIIEKAEEGDEEWLKEHEPNVAFKHLATFRSHKKPRTEVLNYEETPHEWWVGPTGTGKSRRVWEQYPNHYAKDKNKWWCNYTGQDVVVIEEADPKNMEHLADRLKVWADRYPFSGEIKGGRLEGIRPMKVIVTSNYTPEECFPNSNDLEPILRRFKVVTFGHHPPIHPNYKI